MGPFQAFAVLGLLFPSTQNFTPSGNMLDKQRELEARASKSHIRRLKFLLGNFWFQFFVLALNLLGALSCVRTVLSSNISSSQQRQQLFVSAAWPTAFALWTMFIAEYWKPISYAIFPPNTQPREELLTRDPNTKVVYPSDMAKNGGQIRPSQVSSLVILAWGILILACSWGIGFE